MSGDLGRAFRHALIYGGAVAAGKAVGFLMIPVYTRVLTPADYGAMELLDLTTAALGLVLALGLSHAVVRYYFLAATEQERRAVVGTAAVATVLVALAAGTALVPMSPHIARAIAGSRQYASLFTLAILTNVFDAATVVPLAWFRARERSLTYAAVHLLRTALGLALNIWLVVALRLGVKGVMASGLVVAVISGVTLGAAVLGSTRLAFSPRLLAGMLRYGLPLVTASLGMSVLHFADRLFLQRMATMGVVGLYGLSYKFAMTLPVLFGQPLSLMWGPYAFDVARREGGKAVISVTATYFFLAICAYAAVLGALIPEVMRVMAAPRFFEAHAPTPLLLAGFALLASVTLFETGLLIEKRTEWRMVSIASAAAANLLANVILIPRFGMMGAAAATAAGCAVAFAVTVASSQRVCPMPYQWPRLLKAAGSALAAFWLASHIRLDSLPLAVAAKMAVLATIPAWLWVLRFFEPGEVAGLCSAIGKVFVTRGAEA